MANTSRERRGLGRGLSSLIGDLGLDSPVQRDRTASTGPPPDRLVPIEKLRPNPMQPRRNFPSEGMRELARSIEEKGVIQPLIVRPDPEQEGVFQIVAGERRWRAAQMAKRHELPVIVREMTDDEGIEVAIIENIQREDLNPYEEAQGYRQLMDRFGHTQEQLAKVLSKSRSHVANTLRLLTLPADVAELLRTGKISAAHARALVPCENPSELARQIVADGLSVRQAEDLAKETQAGVKTARRRVQKDADTRALEADLSANLNTKVLFKLSKSGESGQILLRYRSLDHLDELCDALREAGKHLRPSV